MCLAACGYYAWMNIEEDVYHSSNFPSNTIINGVDCSKMTIDEAQTALTDEWNHHYVTFKNENEILGSIKLNGVTYDIQDTLINIRKEYFVDTAMNQLFGVPLELSIKMEVADCGTEFDKALRSSDFIKEDVITETKDAYIDLGDPELAIIEEVYGNTIDYDLLKDEIFSFVADGIFGFQYIKSEFYKQPEITADSEELLKRQEFYKENIVSNVTYTLGKDIVNISPETIAEFRGITLNSTGPLTEDEIKDVKKAISDNIIIEEVVREYVYNFARKYNTLGFTRNFKTSSGKIIKVEGGDYGFALNQDAETEQLIADIQDGNPVKRSPLWLMTGFTDYNIKDDIGNTYVEISIKKQHLWYYKNGKKIVECDVVTGNPYMGYSTPTGTFGLSYKQLGATLRGEEADGTEYESPVTYWMPFYGNYGMHDASWRSSFGDDIYLGGGSHGCVNMPTKAAKKVFENIADRKTPVIVYDK